MDKSKGKEILNEVLGSIPDWKPVETFIDKEKIEHPVIFFNIHFKEGKACILRFKVGKSKFDIYVTPSEEDSEKLDFGVVCGPWEEWFSSTNLQECIEFAKNWFAQK